MLKSAFLQIRNFSSIYFHPRVITILFLGFSSGLPWALTGPTLAIWLVKSGISLSVIGVFTAVAIPYSLKFLWSPLMDGFRFPMLTKLLGQRRGWMIGMQLALAASILALGATDPSDELWLTTCLAVLVALFSASQDIVIDAYRVEILAPEQYGAGAAMAVLGYRLGMLTSTAGALFLSTNAGWHATYAIMAALMMVGMVTIFLNQEPMHVSAEERPGIEAWLRAHVVAPFMEFSQRDHWWLILLFILLFKLGDAYMGVMTGPFLVQIGFTNEQIATVVQSYGLIATIVGSFIGGALAARLGIVRTLWICGTVHAITNLMFVWQAGAGANVPLLGVSITLENLSGGMTTSAFIAFLSMLCNARFTATQYALLSSLAVWGRTLLSMPSGWMAEHLGWQGFFLVASLLAIPGLTALWWLAKRTLLGNHK